VASRPRNRRWRPLEKFDRELEQLAQRQAEAQDRLREAEEALRAAPTTTPERLLRGSMAARREHDRTRPCTNASGIVMPHGCCSMR
jgi:hypothetical protein